MTAEFAGQVAVVTGAAKGLGRTIATMLAERGATLFLADIDRAGLDEVERALRDNGSSAYAITTDVADEDELARLREAIVREAGGRLDILINNAGGWRHGRVHEISLTDWEWTFRTNVTGPFLTARTLIGLMVDQGYGRVVNVASTDAHRAKPTLPHYAAAKAAVVSLTKSLAEEFAPQQILVNAVSPGAIATETAKQQAWFAERIKSIPLGRAAEPEDISEVILFLASSRNRFIVGQTVMVNGGLYMA